MKNSKSAVLPFDAKNEEDFIAVTKRIHSALDLLRNDRRLKRTEVNLAKLAQCSRGTLHNREWPINELKLLKKDTKASEAIESKAHDNAHKNTERSRVERYKKQLFDSRDEVLSWKFRHDDLAERLEAVSTTNKIQKDRIESLEAHVRALEKKIHSSGRDSKVLPLKGKNQ